MNVTIRMADLAARHRTEADDVEAAVLDVLRAGRWVGGPAVEAAEAAAARLFGRQWAVGVASGTDALMLSLQVAGVEPGAAVALPALSFFATAGAVRAIGAVPVFVDVDDRGLLCQRALDALDASALAAVVPVHLFGEACQARLPGVLTVDDAAQAACAPTPGGTLTAVSTYPTKLWCGLGDGGFVLGEDPALRDRVHKLGNHGAAAPHLHVAVGAHTGRNSRLDAVSAAALVARARHLPERIARRRAIAAYYDAHLPAPIAPLPRSPDNPVPTYCVRSPERDALAERLRARGVETAVYYPRPLHRQPALAPWAVDVRAPRAERLCDELLALPVHEGLSDTDVERVVAAAHPG